MKLKEFITVLQEIEETHPDVEVVCHNQHPANPILHDDGEDEWVENKSLPNAFVKFDPSEGGRLPELGRFIEGSPTVVGGLKRYDLHNRFVGLEAIEDAVETGELESVENAGINSVCIN